VPELSKKYIKTHKSQLSSDMSLWLYDMFYQLTGLCTAKNQYRKFETNIPRKECFYERFIYSHDRSAYSAAGNMWTDPGNILIAHRHMNGEIWTEAAQFPEKEYINGIFVAGVG
jgi:hypothetical protein